LGEKRSMCEKAAIKAEPDERCGEGRPDGTRFVRHRRCRPLAKISKGVARASLNEDQKTARMIRQGVVLLGIHGKGGEGPARVMRCREKTSVPLLTA